MRSTVHGFVIDPDFSSLLPDPAHFFLISSEEGLECSKILSMKMQGDTTHRGKTVIRGGLCFTEQDMAIFLGPLPS